MPIIWQVAKKYEKKRKLKINDLTVITIIILPLVHKMFTIWKRE
ncbi:MAG: hypothetical protein IJC45_09980 [Clostridia bacterium]|nr:hypothetical protein [Clostridia bacterium]